MHLEHSGGIPGSVPGDPLTLDAGSYRRLVTHRLPAMGLSGGATYDALIAEMVRAADGTLVTLDRRALAPYDRIGCGAELLGAG
ncbi:MAG: hypothetical protein ACR2P2_10325 [Nakamurella sp.]